MVVSFEQQESGCASILEMEKKIMISSVNLYIGFGLLYKALLSEIIVYTILTNY